MGMLSWTYINMWNIHLVLLILRMINGNAPVPLVKDSTEEIQNCSNCPHLDNKNKQNKKRTPWSLVRERTIPTDDRHLLVKFSANFCG
jgi:hypothetical protein